MNRFIEVLYKPSCVFQKFDNVNDEDLDTDSNLIASIFGCFVGLNTFIIEFNNINRLSSGWGLVVICVLILLLSGGIFVLVYNYVFTYILYWVGKLLGSHGDVAGTRTSIVYSTVPIMLSLILDLIVKLMPETLLDFNPQFWLLWSISFLAWAWTMIILVSGLITFNKYGVVKAIINILPLPVIGLILFQIRQLIV